MTRETIACGLARTVLVVRGQEERYASLLLSAQTADVDCFLVSEGIIEALSTAKTPQGILTVAEIPRQTSKLSGMRILALDGVQDPGNVGTMIRTADAAGMDGVIIGYGCADPFGPKAVRGSMGSVLRLPIFSTSEATNSLPYILSDLKMRGYSIVSTELNGLDFFEACPTPPMVLVIGNEGRGISEEIRSVATHHLTLPMRGGAESLNAAIAAGIMMYEVARR